MRIGARPWDEFPSHVERPPAGTPDSDVGGATHAFRDAGQASAQRLVHRDAASEAFLSRKGHAVVGQDGMYAEREGYKHLPKELRCVGFRCPVKERDMREFCDAIYGNKHVMFAAGDLHFSAVDVHEAECHFFELSVPSWHVRCGLLVR